MNCAVCGKKSCDDGDMCKEIEMDYMAKYDDPENRSIFETASKVESEGYMKLTRLQEIIKFSQDIGYKHIGIAFCIGLEDEAKILYKILKQHFRMSSICCKVCSVNKDDMGIVKIIEDSYEAMCNPIAQAEILNKRKTDMNIICGLCIGHDILFTKHSVPPVTTFIVKDRILGHNPAASLYSNYTRKILMQK